ncbi:MAG: DNA primase [Candidatus Dojkabacteria bacterium]
MAGDSQIEDIKQRLDIAEVVQAYVPTLKPAGRNMFGLCPFHNESTPSFSVNPELQIFKCFGCGEGGDVLTFLQKVEGLDFRGALELAAKKAGVELKQFDSPEAKKRKKERERALEAHLLASDYFHYLLLSHNAGKEGLDYATRKRKLQEKQIKQYKLGFAPKGFHNLEKFLSKKGFSKDELVRFGLLVNKNGRIYDKFRNRLMHPIRNMQGEVVGFSGRAIDPDEKGPKYLNSPETMIYHKKKLPYGAFEAKEAMRQKKYVILVEGNIDIISSARVGVENIVCPLGTALTVEQSKLLKRYVDSLYFCFDTDQAGKKALLRALERTEKEGVEAKAVDLGDYKDADDLILAEPKLWQHRINKSQEIPEFIMQIFQKDFDLGSSGEKLEYIEMVLPFIKRLQDQVKTDHYLQELERITGAKYEVLVNKLNKSHDAGHVNATEEVADKKDVRGRTLGRVPSRPSRLDTIVTYINRDRDRLDDIEGIVSIFKGNVKRSYENLLLLVLTGEYPKEKSAQEHVRAELSEIMERNIRSNSVFENPEKEITAMIKSFVRAELRSYLQVLRYQQARLADLGESDEKVIERIQAYNKKLAEL